MRRHPIRVLCLSLMSPVLTLVSFAVELPVKTYTTGEGLPRDEVTLVRQDSRGLIWVAAGDGVSRFDGYTFTNYTTEDGLADRRVNDLIETRGGVYWVATSAGLSRFNPGGAPMFDVYNPGAKPLAFNALAEDDAGVVWCGTDEGVYRLEASPEGGVRFHHVDLGIEPGGGANAGAATALFKDHTGVMWVGMSDSVLYRILPDSRVESYAIPPSGSNFSPILTLLEDRAGNMWAGTRGGERGNLHRLVTTPDPSRPVVARTYGGKDGLTATGWVNSLRQTRDGKIWAATTGGLVSISPAAGGDTTDFRIQNEESRLCGFGPWDIAEDRDGNLWVASQCGVQKISRNGFTGFGLKDGLGSLFINSIMEDRDGALVVINAATADLRQGRLVNRFDGERFTSVEPRLPSHIVYHGWGWGQTVMQDHLGEWWIPTGGGLFRAPRLERFEDLARSLPRFQKTDEKDPHRTEIFRLYEDSRGDVWIATTGLNVRLLRWERATDTVRDLTPETHVTPPTEFTAFREDRAGHLWIGTSETGGLLRYSGGAFRLFTVKDGVPPGWIIDLHLDLSGRLWVASQLGGLNRIDDPSADTPRFVRYSTADGLSSPNVRCITEDLRGRIYVGTGHGVDQLDVQTGVVKHYTAADGLPRGTIENAYRDRGGALWFGSPFGLSRFTAEQNDAGVPPTVYITGLRLGGVTRRVSELGETSIPLVDLASDENSVSVDFVGLGGSAGEELRYQYYLEGAGDDWSAPTGARTINFGNLVSGSYRLSVRARNADGLLSPNPATFDFVIAAPVWRRWWFLSLAVALTGLAVYAAYRYRLNRLLDLERIRTRIATDLHDDVGSGLSQVSVLSEVIRRRVGRAESVSEQLSTIGSLSRDLVDSMSDIVWAVNPGRDRLSDLSQRMRRHASDVLTAHGAGLSFEGPPPGRDVRLGPETRREVYLIFKEALNNVIRHSNCGSVRVTFLISAGALELSLWDDGRGFDPASNGDGNGLANMRRRAERLGGEFRVDSNEGRGTMVKLMAPLDGRRWLALGARRRGDRW